MIVFFALKKNARVGKRTYIYIIPLFAGDVNNLIDLDENCCRKYIIFAKIDSS